MDAIENRIRRLAVTQKGQGATIEFRDPNPEGNDAVLLIHGLGVTGASWQLQIPALISAGFRPLAPDIYGFGGSSIITGQWGITPACMNLWHLLDGLNIDRAHLVGISMGGALALKMARQSPDRVRSLTLVNTFARLRPARLREWGKYLHRYLLLMRKGLRAQVEFVARQLFPLEGQESIRQEMIAEVMKTDPKVYSAAMRSLVRFDMTKELRHILAPTLVITGERDRTISRAIQEELAMGIHGARQVIIPEAGHAVIVDAPEIFNQVLLNFLTRV